jgi:hypothetical protein
LFTWGFSRRTPVPEVVSAPADEAVEVMS